MKIGLIDVDGHNFPNLPLMKISAYHKSKDNTVEWYDPMFGGWYDIVYMSKVFDFTPDYAYPINALEVIKGGTGYSLKSKLPPVVENIYPDYTLYPKFKEAYGFLTRGCPRNCGFCIVSEKEGRKSVQVADLDNFWRGQREIKLLDPNLLACNDRERLLKQLVDSKAWIDFTQGLDIRLMDRTASDLIMQCKIKMLHFAWDSEKDSDLIIAQLDKFKTYTNIDMRKARVYILVNYDTDFAFDLERIYTLKKLGYDPYVMAYDKANAPRHIRHLQRWVNNKIIFRVCDRFEDYDCKIG